MDLMPGQAVHLRNSILHGLKEEVAIFKDEAQVTGLNDGEEGCVISH